MAKNKSINVRGTEITILTEGKQSFLLFQFNIMLQFLTNIPISYSPHPTINLLFFRLCGFIGFFFGFLKMYG